LKLGEWEKCIKVCSDVIGADENNVKAIFRRGKAWLERNNTDRAKEDLLKAIKLAPNDADIRRAYEELRQAMAGEREKQNRVYAKAFANGFGSAEDDTKK
jgi:tetratricopeptide (TPR) repeat protein